MKKINVSIIFIVAFLSNVSAQYFLVKNTWIRTTTYYMQMDAGQYHDEWKETCEFNFYLNTKKYFCTRTRVEEGIIVEIIENNTERIVLKARDEEGRKVDFKIDLKNNIVYQKTTDYEDDGREFSVKMTYLVDK